MDVQTRLAIRRVIAGDGTNRDWNRLLGSGHAVNLGSLGMRLPLPARDEYFASMKATKDTQR